MSDDTTARGASTSMLCGGRLARLLSVSVLTLGAAVAAAAPVSVSAPADPSARRPSIDAGMGFVYNREYPFIDYLGMPKHNEVARLQARIDSGEVKLEYREPRGYLDSLLKALGIDPTSQSVVFSRTSLQIDLISAATPRAIYFNDDTYVAWIAHTRLIEISTMDSLMGAVFYSLVNTPGQPPQLDRETMRCLSCHDTFSLGGGGVPRFLFLSAYTRRKNDIVTNSVAEQTSDETPIDERWGGWYVTGQLGGLRHLGDLLPSPTGNIPAASVHPRDLTSLDSLFDTQPYLTNTSDVVALLVLEHQVDVHNLIIRAGYKCRMLMEALQPGSSFTGLGWEQLPVTTQQRVTALLEPVVRAMLFIGAAKLPSPVHGEAGFVRSFEARGPKDPRGRSLRDLDLTTRLFTYPLSFLIYSDGFDALPAVAKAYIYRRLGEILTGEDSSPDFASLTSADRRAILEILVVTKPDFAHALAREQELATSARVN
jgi:hypothetical protein